MDKRKYSKGIKKINAATMEFETDLDTFKADAASVVPAQKLDV